MQAGIDRAKGLITVVSTDADNLYIVLTARGLNPDLYIVARAGEDGSEKKLHTRWREQGYLAVPYRRGQDGAGGSKAGGG